MTPPLFSEMTLFKMEGVLLLIGYDCFLGGGEERRGEEGWC